MLLRCSLLLFTMSTSYCSNSPIQISTTYRRHAVHHLHRSPPPPPDREELHVHSTSCRTSFGSELHGRDPNSSLHRNNHQPTPSLQFSGDRGTNADPTKCEDSPPISPATVQNHYCVFSTKKKFPHGGAYSIKAARDIDISMGRSVHHDDDDVDPTQAPKTVNITSGHASPSLFPITGQSPVSGESPMGEAAHKGILGQTWEAVSGLGQSIMGLEKRVKNSNPFISPASLGLFQLCIRFKFRQERLLYIDIVHGARVAILMPDTYPLSSKTVQYNRSSIPPFRCINVGKKPEYSVFLRTFVLGYRVIPIYVWFHDVEQTSPSNASIFRFIAILIVIILPLSMTPSVIVSSMSI